MTNLAAPFSHLFSLLSDSNGKAQKCKLTTIDMKLKVCYLMGIYFPKEQISTILVLSAAIWIHIMVNVDV